MRRALPDAAAAVGTVLLAASAWLFFPRERGGDAPELPPLRVVLVDTSASAVWRRRNWNDWAQAELERQIEGAVREGERLRVVLYGEEVRQVEGVQIPSLIRTPPHGRGWVDEDAESPLASALDVARGLQPASIVLVSDGTYTGADPRDKLEQFVQEGIPIHRIEMPPPDVEEIVPGPLSLPEEVEVGSPITASFDLFYAPGDKPPKAELDLSIGAPSFGVQSVRIRVPSGLSQDSDGYLRWRVRADFGQARAGWNQVVVHGHVSSRGVVRGGRERMVAVVRVNEVGPRALVLGDGLEQTWFRWDELAPDLERLDAVVSFDLPPPGFPVPILRSYLERGGGWLALIGDSSLAGFAGGGAGELLPLEPPDERPGPRDVVFLVDRSGSMSGARSENVRRAVFALIDEAPPSDNVELRWFASRLSPGIHLIAPGDSRRPTDLEEARRTAADRLFATETGGGPTAVLGSLRELAEERARSDRESIVFLLSDGRDNQEPDPLASAPLVLDQMRAMRTRLVVIPADASSDRDLLSRLVAPGERLQDIGSLLDGSSAEGLRELFRRELNQGRVRTGEALRVLPRVGPTGLAGEILTAMEPESARDWPTIPWYVRAKAAAGADTLWVSEEAEPLLALQRVGQGMSAACAFLPDAAFDGILSPLVRALARGHRGASPSLRVEGDDLVLEGLPEGAPAALEARVFGADAEEAEPPVATVPLWPSSEGDPQRVRRGRWPSRVAEILSGLWDERASARSLRVEIRGVGAAASSWTPIQLALVPPRAVEFVLPRPRIPPLESSAAAPPGLAARRPEPHPSAPWVLLSGMLLLTGAGLAGSFSRRVR